MDRGLCKKGYRSVFIPGNPGKENFSCFNSYMVFCALPWPNCMKNRQATQLVRPSFLGFAINRLVG